MGNNFAYLVSILLFAGIPVTLEFILGFRLLKPFMVMSVKMIFISLFLVPIWDGVAIALGAWKFSPERNLNIIILGDPLETYIWMVFIVLAIAFSIYTWTYYEDKGLPIIETSFYDVLHQTYAFWKKEIKPSLKRLKK
ncbi:hypothetical protein M1271_00200 [Patescibacteria group bacterium]|nr:hypothetical protein [Patescibacteria group bacterium]